MRKLIKESLQYLNGQLIRIAQKSGRTLYLILLEVAARLRGRNWPCIPYCGSITIDAWSKILILELADH